MPVKNRIETERCPETGRDIGWPWKLSVLSVYCSVTSMSLVHSAFSATWEPATVWGEISPSLSFPELAAFLCLFSVPPEQGHLRRRRMFCRRNLAMCRCWEAGPCIFWQFPCTEFHWRQATETAVWNFILMNTFICNQQVANGEVLMLPSLCRDSPGLWQIWKRLLFSKLYTSPTSQRSRITCWCVWVISTTLQKPGCVPEPDWQRVGPSRLVPLSTMLGCLHLHSDSGVTEDSMNLISRNWKMCVLIM